MGDLKGSEKLMKNRVGGAGHVRNVQCSSKLELVNSSIIVTCSLRNSPNQVTWTIMSAHCYHGLVTEEMKGGEIKCTGGVSQRKSVTLFKMRRQKNYSSKRNYSVLGLL